MSKTATELQRLRDELQIAELKARCAAVDALTEDIARGREVIAYKMKETGNVSDGYGSCYKVAERIRDSVSSLGYIAAYDPESPDAG